MRPCDELFIFVAFSYSTQPSFLACSLAECCLFFFKLRSYFNFTLFFQDNLLYKEWRCFFLGVLSAEELIISGFIL